MKKTISVNDAVGKIIPHDITEIIKDTFKGVAFKKGHIIREEDIDHLKRLGKNNLFVLDLGRDDIHENEAAELLANSLAGPGIVSPGEPQEGKISLVAAHDGLLKIDKETLLQFNMLGEVMCSTLQSNTPVKKGEIVAGTRLIPLISKRKLVSTACSILQNAKDPVIQVKPIKSSKIGLVITGTEIFNGIIEDKFEGVLREKLAEFNADLSLVLFAPDDADDIAEKILKCHSSGVDIIITSGGMSVDPDDVTRAGIKKAGADTMVYGTPVLPGAMFLSGTINKKPILGLPACGMFHKITVFDLILPRILTGEKIRREELAELGHGGLCRNCKQCQYPVCNFGK
jgi:hypothetical protein